MKRRSFLGSLFAAPAVIAAAAEMKEPQAPESVVAKDVLVPGTENHQHNHSTEFTCGYCMTYFTLTGTSVNADIFIKRNVWDE